MISYYPPLLLPYLHLHKAKREGSLFFASWEDALWHLLTCRVIKPNAKIFLPDFYCLDVVGNMHAHGLDVVTYPLNEDLQPHLPTFLKLLKKHRPDIIIIFHPVGLTSALSVNLAWRDSLQSSTLILHDYVHRLKEPTLSDLPTTRDLAINSLRKNIPLSGAHLYAHPVLLARIAKPSLPHPLYLFGALALYSLYRLVLLFGYFASSPQAIRFAHQKVLKAHDNLVGDSKRGNLGSPLSALLTSYINHSYLEKVKRQQVAYYQTHLPSHPSLSIPPIQDSGLLHAFPLVVKGRLSQIVKAQLAPLNVWPKFEDSPWSNHRLVFFLPLGPHLTPADQKKILKVLQKALLA